MKELEELHASLKSRTPGLGEHQLEETRRMCEKVANRLKLGFYVGIGHKLTRVN